MLLAAQSDQALPSTSSMRLPIGSETKANRTVFKSSVWAEVIGTSRFAPMA